MNTDGHRSERLAKTPAHTWRVSGFSGRNLCSSVSICGFASLQKTQLPDLGSIARRLEQRGPRARGIANHRHAAALHFAWRANHLATEPTAVRETGAEIRDVDVDEPLRRQVRVLTARVADAGDHLAVGGLSHAVVGIAVHVHVGDFPADYGRVE